MPVIYWAGDSTVQYNGEDTYPQMGIGQVFDKFVRDGVSISNYAKNGRSTKSFLEEWRIVPIYDNIVAGDFLFVQFGHNDEKIKDPSRYTDPQSTFKELLQKFANVAENKGAIPVFISPITRRVFDENGQLTEDLHIAYTDAMKEKAQEIGAAFIDMDRISYEELKAAGPEETRNWYMNFDAGIYDNYPEGSEDNTHLREAGAMKFAECIARSLLQLGGKYAELIDENKLG